MRVLALTPWFPSKRRPAAGIFTLRDVELLAADHDVTVLHLGRPEDLSAGEETSVGRLGIEVVRLPYSFLSPRSVRKAAAKVRELLKENDALHSMAMSSLLPAALARPRVPWIHTEHFSELVNPELPAHRRSLLRILKNLYRLPDEVVAVGRDLAETIEEQRSKPSWIIGNYVRFPEGLLPRREPHACIRILSVGGLISRKGPLESVEAVAELRDRGQSASLRWAGTGELAQAVKERAAELGMSEHVELLGYVAPEQLGEEFAGADVFLLPTEAETFGVVFAEALAHGLPVVTSGVGGHLDFLPDEGSRVVTERSGVALADAIEQLLGSPTLPSPQELSNYARNSFSEETRRRRYLAAYRSALGPKRTRGTVGVKPRTR